MEVKEIINKISSINNAPLFTNNEKLFKLSDKAQVICIKSYSSSKN